MKLLAQLQINGFSPIQAPSSVPTLQTASESRIIAWAVDLFIFIGILTAIGYFVYGGFKWITSGGDKQKIDQARKTLMFTIIGLILMVLSLAIVKITGQIIGINYF